MLSRKLVLLALVLVAGGAMVLSGCASAANTDPAALEATWSLTSIGTAADPAEADPAVKTEITFDGEQVSGNGGVNTFSGGYEAKDDGSISIGPVASTMMAGPEPAMAQEAAFFQALEKAKSFEISEGTLVLSDEGNNTLMTLTEK